MESLVLSLAFVAADDIQNNTVDHRGAHILVFVPNAENLKGIDSTTLVQLRDTNVDGSIAISVLVSSDDFGSLLIHNSTFLLYMKIKDDLYVKEIMKLFKHKAILDKQMTDDRSGDAYG